MRVVGGGPLAAYLAVEGPRIVQRGLEGITGLREAAGGLLNREPLSDIARKMATPGYQSPVPRPQSPATPGARTSNPADPHGVTPVRAPMPSLPSSARVVSQYPAGVPTGVGGGNAGASAASQWSSPAPAGRPPAAAPAGGYTRPAAVPGIGTAPVVRPAGATQARLLNAAAQQAGLSPAAVRYESAGDDVRLAARNRADMIRAAQASGGELPANLTPASEAWWNDADNRAWAAANRGLANNLRRRHGLSDLDASGQAPWAAPNITFGGAIDRDPNVAFGAQNALVSAPAPSFSAPDSAWSVQARNEAFDPGLDLRPEAPWQPPAGTWQMQSRFNPSLSLTDGEAPAPARQSSGVPIEAAYGSGMDLMAPPAAAPTQQPVSTFDPEGVAAQGLSSRALQRIKQMRPSGIQGGAAFNPAAFSGQALF